MSRLATQIRTALHRIANERSTDILEVEIVHGAARAYADLLDQGPLYRECEHGETTFHQWGDGKTIHSCDGLIRVGESP